MEGIPLLRDLLVLVAVAIPVVIVAHRLRVPTIVGFLITGVVIGPHALAFVRDLETVRSLAEIGAVLLLFAVGLELSLSRVIRIGRYVLQGGAVQLLGTILVVAIAGILAREPLNHSILWGSLIALSSTAIVLKAYADRGDLDSQHGRVVVAILLFQDLAVVPLMVMLPLLAGTAQGPGAVARAILVTVAVTGGIVFLGRLVVPRLLERVANLRNQEIFTLCVLAIGLGAAFLTSSFGLSLALGAFLAGLVVSESEYGLQALSDVVPFRDAFGGLFFTSMGMLLNIDFFAANVATIMAVALGIVVLKTTAGYVVVHFMRRSTRVGVIAGVGLAQVGEFSFVLASVAVAIGLMPENEYQVFLGAAVVTMLAAPFLIDLAPTLAEKLLSRRTSLTTEFTTREIRAAAPLEDHVIIVGYGLNGRNLGRALRSAGISYAILESNGQMVRQARLDREPIFFGDGTRGEVLERVGVKRARLLVFAIASHQDEKRGIVVARHLNPALHIVARTRYVSDMEELHTLGANEVVPEEFETSLEIFVRVLRRYSVPESRIREQAEEARRDHYELLRQRGTHLARVDSLLAPVAVRPQLEAVVVQAGSPATESTLAQLDLRHRTGARLVAVIRGRDVRYDIEGEIRFADGDTVVLVGDRASLSAAGRLFSGGPSSATGEVPALSVSDSGEHRP